jgi:hypothetical protein
MNDTAANQVAYQTGEVIGVVLVLGLFLGIAIFFIVALVKAFSTRRTGWIVAASVSSIPFLFMFAAFMVGVVTGIKRAVNHSAEISAARKGEPSELLTAAMSPVSGNAMAYQISLPGADEWAKHDNEVQFDRLFSCRDAYIGVIAEGIGLTTPQNVCEISQKHLAAKVSDCTFTTPQSMDIDSHSWLTYDATATIRSVRIKYRFYVYADTNYTFQIVGWTGPVLFDRDAPVFDRIAKSFKMPQ